MPTTQQPATIACSDSGPPAATNPAAVVVTTKADNLAFASSRYALVLEDGDSRVSVCLMLYSGPESTFDASKISWFLVAASWPLSFAPLVLAVEKFLTSNKRRGRDPYDRIFALAWIINLDLLINTHDDFATLEAIVSKNSDVRSQDPKSTAGCRGSFPDIPCLGSPVGSRSSLN